jgi:hypothetical protein
MAASLARIGTVALPSSTLRKVARDAELDPSEQTLLAEVPMLGWQMLKSVPRFERVAEAVRYQAKHFDGAGYPADEVNGATIPLGARILKVFMDRAALEVEGMAKAQARRELESRGGVYDQALVAASFQCFPDYILSGISATEQIHLVSVDDLRADLTIVAEIRTKENVLFVAAGTRLTPLIVQRIKTHVSIGNVSGPFCVQSPSSGSSDPVSSGSTPVAAVTAA